MQQNNLQSFASFQAVTPSDTTLITCASIYVSCTVAGNVTIAPSASAAAVTFAVPTGIFILPIELNQGRILSTGLTATATIIALA
jgi:hypothetical protein